jgi:hypothetical protein
MVTKQDTGKLLKLGDKLYRRSRKGSLGRLFTYIVTEKWESEKGVTYIVECENCTDHDTCIVRVKPVDNDTFNYQCMLDDDDYQPQYYWHNQGAYYRTLEDADLNYYKDLFKTTLAEVEQKRNDIRNTEQRLDEISDKIKELEHKL